MADRIVVTDTGIISALGIGRDEHISALYHSRSGLRYTQYLETIYAEDFLVGEVRSSNDELSALLGLPQAIMVLPAPRYCL